MLKISKCLNYFITGISYGAISYLCILAFLFPGVAPTVKGVVSVFAISGLMGLLSMIIDTDLPLISALAIHLVGTFLLFIIMAAINGWQVTGWTLTVFVLIYAIIWLICILEQKKSLKRINSRIKRRNLNKH